MTYTSSEANKLLKEKNDEYTALLRKEELASEFIVSLGEDPETVRPEYSFTETRAELDRLMGEIRKIKHAINVFNSTTIVPEFEMTIDQMLVYIPQLTAQKNRLNRMRGRLPKQREKSYGSSNLVEYSYANYEIKQAEEEYERVSRELARAQTALDVVNNSVKFEI